MDRENQGGRRAAAGGWRAVLAAVLAAAAAGCATPLWTDEKPQELPILQRWSGDYPVAMLDRLPEAQRRSRVGALGDQEAFAAVWQGFKPGTVVPRLDFEKHLVVFVRNTDFYNRLLLTKVVLAQGVAEVVAAETLSARPIDAHVAMALAVVPRRGVAFLQAGADRVAVP